MQMQTDPPRDALASSAATFRGVDPGILAIAGLGLVLRIACIAAVGIDSASFDVDGYHAQALAGLHGPVPSDHHPPGYPWFLLAVYAVVGQRPRAVYVIQALLSTVAIICCGVAASRRWGRRAGRLTASLLAVSGYLAFFTSALATETLCGFAIAVLVWALLPEPRQVPATVLLGAALWTGLLALVRTAFLALAPGVAALALFSLRPGLRPLSRRLGLVVAALVVALAPVLGHAALRAERDGYFRVGSPFDVYNFWMGNNPHATGRVDPMPRPRPLGSPDLPVNEALARRVGPDAWKFLFTEPARELVLLARRVSYQFALPKRDLIYVYSRGWVGERPPAALIAAFAWVAVSSLVLMLAFLLSLIRGGRDAGLRAALGFLTLGCAPYLISIGDARYLMPLYPLLAFGAAAGASPRPRPAGLRVIVVGVILALFLANAAYDLWATRNAFRTILAPGGSRLNLPYHFAR
jgi:4-amino-4-deoxy-L-arabinose transferase-like glycosyltransferase